MKAKNWFFDRIQATNKVRMEKLAVEQLEHSSAESLVKFAGGGGVRARMVVDCTGHAKRFCEFEQVRAEELASFALQVPQTVQHSTI